MVYKRCTVIGCANDERSDGVEFFPFPDIPSNRNHVNTLMRQIWTRCTGRRELNWSPSRLERHLICSEHFAYGRPSLFDPFPTLRLPVSLSYVLGIIDHINTPREKIFQFRSTIPWQPKRSGTAKNQPPSIIPLPSVGEVFSLDHVSTKFQRSKADDGAAPINNGKLVVAALDTIVHVGINNAIEEDMILDGEDFSLVVTSGVTNSNDHSIRADDKHCLYTEYQRQETLAHEKESPITKEAENNEECSPEQAVTMLAVQQEIYSTEHTYCTCQPAPIKNAVTAQTSSVDYTPEEGEIEIVHYDKEQPETIEVPSDDESEVIIPFTEAPAAAISVVVESTSTSPIFEETTALQVFEKSRTAQFKKNRSYRTSLFCSCHKNRHLSMVNRIKFCRVKKMLGSAIDSQNCSMCPDKFSSLRESALHVCQSHLKCQVLCLRCLQYIPANEKSQRHKCRLKFFGFKQMQVLTEKIALDSYYSLSPDLSEFRNSLAPGYEGLKLVSIAEKRKNFPLSLNRWHCNRCSEYIANDDKESLLSHVANSHNNRCVIRKNMDRFCKICNHSFVGILKDHLRMSHMDDIYDLPVRNEKHGRYRSIKNYPGLCVQKSADLSQAKQCVNALVIVEPQPTLQSSTSRQSDFLAQNFALHKRDSIPPVSKPVSRDFSYWKRRSRQILASKRPSTITERRPCGRFHSSTLHCWSCNMDPKKIPRKKKGARKNKQQLDVNTPEMIPSTSKIEATFGNIWDEFKSKILSNLDDDDSPKSVIDSKLGSLAHGANLRLVKEEPD